MIMNTLTVLFLVLAFAAMGFIFGVVVGATFSLDTIERGIKK